MTITTIIKPVCQHCGSVMVPTGTRTATHTGKRRLTFECTWCGSDIEMNEPQPTMSGGHFAL